MNRTEDDDFENEDAGNLVFGKAFSPEVMGEFQCLSIAEMKMVLERHKTLHENEGRQTSPAFEKTYAHVKRFGPTVKDSHMLALRGELQHFNPAGPDEQKTTDREGQKPTLHSFEVAQVVNLIQPDSLPEEAIALIPSLGTRFSEEQVDQILDIVRKALAERAVA